MSAPRIPRSHIIYTIAIIGFIYTLHLVIPMYSNSSFLLLFTDERTVGFIYMVGSALSILGFLFTPHMIRRVGNYAASLWLVCIQILILWVLITATNPTTIVIAFILQYAVVSLIGFTLDLFLEAYTDGIHVGKIRGLYTATLNSSWVIAPLLGTMLINGNYNYHNTYVAALAMLFPLLYLIYRNFPRFKDPEYDHSSPLQLIKHIASDSNWVRLFSVNTVLQTFYAWMVIYSPIYLNTIIGFTWEDIGIILVIMLIPFPLIQYPLGVLSDKIGERKIMSFGFIIMGISTILLALITIKSVAMWATLLFVTRIGAAAAEIMIETYFFKKVSIKDSSILGAFRITRPVSYFLAPLITGFGLIFMTHEYLFVLVGVLCLVAIYPTIKLKEVR